MNPPIELTTGRPRLRQWRDSDLAPFAALNADARVMEFFPSTFSAQASAAAVERWRAQIAERGWGLWAVETLAAGEFIGFVGLQVPAAALPFSPCVEIGWRLAHAHWGKGYASEAARESLRTGFDRLGLEEIVSFTAVGNRRSRAVMERIGMRESASTFEHPNVPSGSPLREHCLCRLSRSQFRQNQSQPPIIR